MLVGHGSIFGKRVVQRDQVISRDVVSIRLGHFLRESPTVLLVTKTKQILRELNLGRQVTSVEGQRAVLIRRALGESVLLRQFAADDVIDDGVVRPKS